MAAKEASKGTASARTGTPQRRKTKATSHIAGLASSAAPALATSASGASHPPELKKGSTRKPPGGDQLPQGARAYEAGFKELYRAKSGKLSSDDWQRMYAILLAVK